MRADDLLGSLRAAGMSFRATDDDQLLVDAVEPITAEQRVLIQRNKPRLLAAVRRQARSERVLTMLAERPKNQRAVLVEPSGHADIIVVAIGIRGAGLAELSIEADRFDEGRMHRLLVDTVLA